MFQNANQTITALRRIGAPEFLIRIAQGGIAHGELRGEVQTPRTYYLASANDSKRFPFGGRLIPLWETNGDSLTAYVEGTSPRVIRYYYGDPSTEYEVVGHSIWEAIEHRLGWLVHETGAAPNDVLEAASACGHPHPENLVQRLSAEFDAE